MARTPGRSCATERRPSSGQGVGPRRAPFARASRHGPQHRRADVADVGQGVQHHDRDVPASSRHGPRCAASHRTRQHHHCCSVTPLPHPPRRTRWSSPEDPGRGHARSGGIPTCRNRRYSGPHSVAAWCGTPGGHGGRHPLRAVGDCGAAPGSDGASLRRRTPFLADPCVELGRVRLQVADAAPGVAWPTAGSRSLPTLIAGTQYQPTQYQPTVAPDLRGPFRSIRPEDESERHPTTVGSRLAAACAIAARPSSAPYSGPRSPVPSRCQRGAAATRSWASPSGNQPSAQKT